MDNKSIITERIKQAFRQTDLSVSDFARKIGLSRAGVYNIFNGTQPSPDVINRIANVTHVSVDYLLGRSETPNIAGGYSPIGIIDFPVIATVRAGYGGELVEYDTGETLQIPVEMLHGRSADEFMVFQIKGDSMYPRLFDGDKVLVLRTESVDSGKTAVVVYNGDEATVKRVEYREGEDWLDLVPANPAYPRKHIMGADLSLCRVVGEVKALIRTDF